MLVAILAVSTHLLFLDREGVTIHPGPNDARAETSGLVAKPMHFPGWDTDDDTWDATVACMRDMWAPFDLDVTDVDPGDNVAHVQVVFGGLPIELGIPATSAGVSPMRTDCGVIENSVVFAFPQILGHRSDLAQVACEVIAQEVGHSFGLDHELDADDPMTYLPRSGPRTFQDRAVSCGESVARPCGNTTPACRPSQSSYAILLDRLGPARAPETTTTTPEDNGFGEPAGCAVGSSTGTAGVLLALSALADATRRRRR